MDRALGGLMIVVALAVFLYYTTWALVLVGGVGSCCGSCSLGLGLPA